MKKLKLLIICCLCVKLLDAQDAPVIDYHVHIFTDTLLANLEERGIKIQKGVYEVDCSSDECLDLEKIKANNSEKLVLLSTGYAFQDTAENSNKVNIQNLVEKENDILHQIVDSDRQNLYGFCGINPNWKFAIDEVSRCIDDLKLDGIKMHFQANKIDLHDSTTTINLNSIFKKLSIQSKPALIHLNGSEMSKGSDVAQAFINNFLQNTNQQTIIFAHTGGPGGLYGFTIDVLKQFSTFISTNQYSQYKKIYFELSGTFLTFRYPGKVENEELIKMIDEIGTEHFLFGSDYPFRNSTEYQKLLEKELKLDDGSLNEILTRNIFEKK